MSARRVIWAVALSVPLFLAPGHALAQSERSVGVVTSLGGEATVARAMRTQPISLRRHDDVFMHDRITTRERSLVRVLLGNKALVTVRELSVLTITEASGRATVDLQSGKFGMAAVRRLMSPGEVIELRTPNAVIAVRGTVLVVETVPDAAGRLPSDPSAVVTNVHLLHGTLDVGLRNVPAVVPVQLESRQTLQIVGDVLGPVRPMSDEAIAAATAGLRGAEQARTGLPMELLGTLAAQQQLLVNATAGIVGPGPLGTVGTVLRPGPNVPSGEAVERMGPGLPLGLPAGLVK